MEQIKNHNLEDAYHIAITIINEMKIFQVNFFINNLYRNSLDEFKKKMAKKWLIENAR